MAFGGRGEGPSSSGGGDRGSNNDNNFHHGGFGLGPHMHIWQEVSLDNTYVLMSMIITFFILIVGGITYLVSYKSTIIDPIADIKKAFINVYSVIIIGLLAITAFNMLKIKEKEKLLKNITVIFVFSMLAMLMYFFIKINLDSNYTESFFEQCYIEQSESEANKIIDTTTNNKISVELGGVSLKTDEEYYIDECVKLYKIFKIKTAVMIGLHFLFNILLIFIIIKELGNKEQRNKLNKDDSVLFDEEQNVKI